MTIPKKTVFSLANLKYSVLSQILVIIFGVIRAIAIPAYLGVTDFGYWQVYLLYVGFVGVLSLGFNDGIYLRYGGINQNDLPWSLLRSSFVYYLMTLCLLSLFFLVILQQTEINHNKYLSLTYVIINITLVGCSSLFLFIFQTTNQIKKYSVYILIDKIIFILVLAIMLVFDGLDFESLMILDCTTKLLLVIIMLVDCREFIVGKYSSYSDGFFEFCRNLSVGIKLMLANLASMLVLAISRFFLEEFYTIEEFSMYSFGITLTNLVLLAVSGVSVMLYPALKQLKEDRYKAAYISLSELTSLFLAISIGAYFPIYYFIFNWMPDYSQVLDYFNVLFVLMLFQVKQQLVINTFYKTLRKENAMLIANIVCVVLTIALSIFVVFYSKTVTMVALALLLTIIYRVYQSDRYLRGLLAIKSQLIITKEIILFVLFIILTNTVSIQISLLIYITFIMPYLFSARFKIKRLYMGLKDFK